MNKKIAKYVKEYQWSNIFAMIKNNRLEPKICHNDFKKKLVVITGATSGIGLITAHKYASKGANILCINRNQAKSDKLKKEIENEFGVECNYLIADLSNLQEVHNVAKALLQLKKPIDVLIHNAGVYLTKQAFNFEGIDKIFMVHYLSTFIINYTLLDKLKSQENARIILVNSEGHRFAVWGVDLNDLNWKKRRYSGLKSYGSAKTAQLLTMLVFKELFQNTNVTINAMHPGAVKTETGQENGSVYRWFKRNFLDKALKSAEISAEAIYYLGVSKEVGKINGKFFNLTTEEEPTPPSLDIEMAHKLWDISVELGKINDFKS